MIFMWPFDKKITERRTLPLIRPYIPLRIKEQKGLIKIDVVGFREEWGEEHPFDFQLVEDMYKQVPILAGSVNKTVDMVIGSNHFIESEDEGLKELLEEFIQLHKFDLLLRNILRDVLVYGNSFVELIKSDSETITDFRVLSPKYMYVKRDEFGVVKGYTQRVREMGKQIVKQEIIEFNVDDIAHFKINVIGDSAYGMSLIAPLTGIIEKTLNLEESLATLMERKANQPIIFRVGNPEHEPTDEDIRAIGQDLEVLTNRTEFAIPYFVEVDALRFGPIAEKFAMPFEHFHDQLIYGLEVPEVVLGKGAIPEGLAKVQLDVLEKRIESIRLNIEETLEEKILKRVAEANGYVDVKFDFQWEPESEEDKWEEVEHILTILSNPIIAPEFAKPLKDKLMQLLDIEETEIMPVVPEKLGPAYVKEVLTPEEVDFFLNAYEEVGFDKVEWVAIVDKRTDKEICLPADGKVFTIKKAKGKIPAHPNCRCRWVPHIVIKP